MTRLTDRANLKWNLKTLRNLTTSWSLAQVTLTIGLLTVLAACAGVKTAPEELPEDYVIPQGFLEPAERASLPAGVTPRPVIDDGIQLTAQFEGWRSKLYNDPVGYCTVGYGHLVKKAKCDGTGAETPFLKGLTKQEGVKLLSDDMLNIAVVPVMLMVKVELTDGQFAALCDFAYNAGPGRLRKSDMLKLINEGEFDGVAAQFRRYVKAGGKTLKGLVNRREKEIELFYRGLPIPRAVAGEGQTLEPIDITAPDDTDE